MKRRATRVPDPKGDLRAIRKLAADWRSGWLAGDADALVSLYDEHPVLMPQGRPVIAGKAAIRALYRAIFREVTITSRGRLMEVRSSGDWGFFWSTYSLTARPRTGGTAIRSKGKSLFIVRRNSNGAWRIARLMDNSDLPE